MTTTTTIVLIGDKSTVQVLDVDSGAGEANPDRVYVPLTGAFAPGDVVWLTDDNSPGEAGVINAIVANDYLELTANLANLFSVAQSAQVVLCNDVSDSVIDLDTWRDRQKSIGTCKILLDNANNLWGDGKFIPDDPIITSVNGSVLWVGLVDNVKPLLLDRGNVINRLVLTGRDFGRHLLDCDVYDYPTNTAAAGVIIDEVLALAEVGDPLLYTDPGGTPTITVSYQNVKLGDVIRDVCERAGWDFYIDNNRRLQFINAGTVDSGVNLTMGGVSTDTLLSFEELEAVGFSIKNYIKVSAGQVDDHYTEDKTGWATAGAAAAADDSAIAVKGDKSIKLTINAAGVSQIYLDFSAGLFGYNPTVDLSDICEAKVLFRGTIDVGNYFSIRPYLVDDAGNKIVFARTGKDPIIGGTTTSKGKTEQLDENSWTQLSYPLGDHSANEIKTTVGTALRNGYWTYQAAAAAFDWTAVEIMGFEWPHAIDGEVLIDWWVIPNLDAIAIAQDAGSITSYGKRSKYFFKKQLKSQTALTAFAIDTRDFMKDPVVKFKAVARGQVTSLYPALVVDVIVPTYTINDAYIISVLHHTLHNTRTVRGWDFLTNYTLAASDVPAWMVVLADNYVDTALDALKENNAGYQGTISTPDVTLGDISSGHIPQETRGTTFPTIVADGDFHWLTADIDPGPPVYYGLAGAGVLYTYDEGTSLWTRDAIVMHRAAQPPLTGALIGDTWNDTTNDILYRCTAEDPDVWTQIDLAATVISGTLSATQLKKGIQPFDSNVLVEALRVIATSAVTFDFDQDNGGGKTEITASAGTPFSDFAAGDVILVQMSEDDENNATGEIVDVLLGGGAGIRLTNTIVGGTDNANDETMIVSVTDAVKWTGDTPAVWFADGTNQNIANGSDHTLALDDTYWVIFTVGANVTLTNTYPNAVGDTVGIVARVTTKTGQEPLIFPVFNRQGSTTLDFLGAGVIDTHTLTGEALIGKFLKSSDGVDWADGVGDPGTIMTRLGIKGKGAAGVTQFALSSVDGKGYFGAGAIMCDATGLTIDGNLLFFNDAASNLCGYVYGSDPGGAANLKLYMVSTALRDIYIWAAKKLYLRSDDGGLDAITVVSDTTFNTKGTFITNLRIPAGNADPAALVSGDIWLREDL